MSSTTPVAFLLEHDFPWLQFIAAKGPEGARWVEEYNQPELDGIYSSITGTFPLMRKGRLGEALQKLEQAREDLEAREGSYSSSVLHMHECWYHGALAFYHYYREDFSLAEATLLRGQHAITLSIEEEPAVLPTIYRCGDTWLHRARIARNQRSWDAMRDRVDRYHATVRGEEPYCTLSDGRGLFAADLEEYLGGLTLEDPALREYVEVFCDRRNLTRLSQSYTQKIYILPWFPIRY